MTSKDFRSGELDVVSAMLADPDNFFAARAAGVSSSDFFEADLAPLWRAAECCAANGDAPDGANLLCAGADRLVLTQMIQGATSIGLRRGIQTVLAASRQRRLLNHLVRAAEFARDPDTIDEAERLIAESLDGGLPSGLGHGVTAAALCRKPPESPIQVIEGVLYGGGTMMLSGASKSRKTYTFLDLGLSVATGSEWLGFPTTKAPVVYLNFELAEHSFAHRLIAICGAKRIDPPASFRSFNLRGRTMTLENLAPDIHRMLRGNQGGLVILDPWYKLSATSGAEENSNDQQARILAAAERVVTSTGAALVVGHHFAKGDSSAKNSIDRAAGAGAMARWGDAIATLTEHEEPDAMTLELHLRDFAPVSPFVLRWTYPVWHRDGALDPAKLKKRSGRSDEHPASRLLAVLTDGMSAAAWRTAAGWHDSTFRRKRDELCRAGQVVLRFGLYYRKAA